MASCARLKTGMDSIGLNVTIMSGRSTCVLCDHGDSVRDVCEKVAHLLGMSANTFAEKGRLVHGIDEVLELSVFEPGLIHEVSLVLRDTSAHTHAFLSFIPLFPSFLPFFLFFPPSLLPFFLLFLPSFLPFFLSFLSFVLYFSLS